MEKIWLKSYPGRTARRQPRAVPLCGPPAGRVLPQTRKSPFSVCMDRWMNYGELERLSGALGAYLQGLGLQPGARVAIMLPNIPQFGVTMAAVLRAGYTCVNVNPLARPRANCSTSSGLGATAIVILELCPHPGRSGRASAQHVVHRLDGRHAGPLVRPLDHLRRAPSGRRWCPPTSCR